MANDTYITTEVYLDPGDLKRFSKALVNLTSKIEDNKKLKAIFRKNAKPYTVAGQAAAPKHKKPGPVKRYSTPKIDGRKKAPKGMGRVVAEYESGNLARSLQVLNLRRLKRSILIGYRRFKGNPKGTFSGARVDGWYAHFIEGGTKKGIAPTPFTLNAWNASKNAVFNGIVNDLKAEIARAKL